MSFLCKEQGESEFSVLEENEFIWLMVESLNLKLMHFVKSGVYANYIFMTRNRESEQSVSCKHTP